jgi:hypothetical protein
MSSVRRSEPAAGRLDLDRIRDEFSGAGLVDLIAGRKGPASLPTVKLEQRGARHWGCCPFHNDGTPSLIVDQRGWKCFGCGAGGSAFDFVMQAMGCDFMTAARALGGDATSPIDPALLARRKRRQAEQAEQDRLRHQARLDVALKVWAEAKPDDQILSRYFEARGITGIEIPPALRLIPAAGLRRVIPWARAHEVVGRWPAMVSAIVRAERISAVHLTFLKPDGRGKAPVSQSKIMLGHPSGAAIPLTRLKRTLAIGEGIETCLSVMMARPEWAFWCAGSLGNLGGPALGKGQPHPTRADVTVPSTVPDMTGAAIEVPELVGRVIILGDGDSDREVARATTERARRRYERAGFKVEVLFPGGAGLDFNDRLQAAG